MFDFDLSDEYFRVLLFSGMLVPTAAMLYGCVVGFLERITYNSTFLLLKAGGMFGVFGWLLSRDLPTVLYDILGMCYE